MKQYSGGTSGGGGFPGPVLAFWSQVLAQRVRDFVSGGLGAEPPYQNGVSPASEVARLIDNSGNVHSHFSPMIAGGRGSPSLSWQLFEADGQAAVSLDAFYAKPVGEGYQTLDLGFYASAKSKTMYEPSLEALLDNWRLAFGVGRWALTRGDLRVSIFLIGLSCSSFSAVIIQTQNGIRR